MEKGQKQWLIRKATKYIMVNDELYCKGKDPILCRVPIKVDIHLIISSCYDGTCGGHFGHDCTTKKIAQVGFVWPNHHFDVQHYCRTCKVCQEIAPRKLTYEPQTPILFYGPFEKWGIDAIDPLPTIREKKSTL